jgi:aspartyl aminopeptidase
MKTNSQNGYSIVSMIHHDCQNNLSSEKAAKYRNLILEMKCKSIFSKSMSFQSNSNIFRSCGGTVGPMQCFQKVASGTLTVNVGNAMLSMHHPSPGSRDALISFFEGFSDLYKGLKVD